MNKILHFLKEYENSFIYIYLTNIIYEVRIRSIKLKPCII